MKLKYLELHKPLFFAGRNFTEKLDGKRFTDIRMDYDAKERMVHVVYNGSVCYIPIESVHSMIELDSQPVAEPVKATFMGKIKAQVSTPYGSDK